MQVKPTRRWTKDRIAIMQQAINESWPRQKALDALQAAPGTDLNATHLNYILKEHATPAQRARMAWRVRHDAEEAQAKRQAGARRKLEEIRAAGGTGTTGAPMPPMEILADRVEVVAYAREVGMTGRITLAAVNAHRLSQQRDPFRLVL